MKCVLAKVAAAVAISIAAIVYAIKGDDDEWPPGAVA